ncbi:MAG: type III pantothenate kinase, partial [Synergistaceae bacterium]|nr:type III pantothenate kinase [Synergistaceae bacterium]
MLLVIDVGNTTTVIGIFDDENLIAHWRLSSILHTSDELGIYILTLLNTQNIKPSEIHGAAFASVVPPLNFSIREAVKKFFHVTPL